MNLHPIPRGRAKEQDHLRPEHLFKRLATGPALYSISELITELDNAEQNQE